MMKYTAVYKNTGQVFGVLAINSLDELPTDESLFCVQGEYDGGKYYFKDNLPQEIPARPQGEYNFNYSTGQWAVDTQATERAVKKRRQSLLASTDWTQIPNGPLSIQEQAAWAVYRQALRDITEQSGYPTEVVWPTK
jgi:hypothetical protein